MSRAVTIISFLLLWCDFRKSEALSSSPSNPGRRRKRVVFTTHQVAPPLESLSENKRNNLCQPLPITYTNDPVTIGNWIHENIYSSPYSHVGFDVEVRSSNVIIETVHHFFHLFFYEILTHF